ncbi:MAG: endonuclease III [Bacteroidales bacterium]|nr:endonuclease III [Bacteroidales bacterium]
MTKKERFETVVARFQEWMPQAESELHYGSPFQLLVAVILSAQCTDKRVNLVTPALFARYPDAQAMAAASLDDILGLIKSISYPNSKAAHLLETARQLQERFDGAVPSDIDTLMSLPGVGRKTANVIASIIYDQPVIAVDTHVFRVSHRLGLSQGKTPEAVERDLENGIPEALRARAHHWLILFGRYTCKSQRPLCASCPFSDLCAAPAEVRAC